MRMLGVGVGLLEMLGVGVELLRMLGVGVGSQTIRLRNPADLFRRTLTMQAIVLSWKFFEKVTHFRSWDSVEVPDEALSERNRRGWRRRGKNTNKVVVRNTKWVKNSRRTVKKISSKE